MNKIQQINEKVKILREELKGKLDKIIMKYNLNNLDSCLLSLFKTEKFRLFQIDIGKICISMKTNMLKSIDSLLECKSDIDNYEEFIEETISNLSKFFSIEDE